MSIFPRLIKGMDGCFPTANKVDNQPLATLGISRLVIVIVTLPFRENPVQSPSGSCLSMGMLEQVLVVGCPSSHQQAGIREETLESGNLFSGS